MATMPPANFITPIEDSRRWRNIVRRPGDIVIGTPPKSGTTWMQGIVTALLWPHDDAPGTRHELSPWIDVRITPLDALVEQVEAQTHRRYFKTHSPGDCVPFDRRCRYIGVYRDGRDSLVSWGNHRSKMRPEVVKAMNAVAATEEAGELAPVWDGDYDTLWPEWQAYCSPVRHLASWWPRRHESNVLFVHYADLSKDLPAEMKRIAEFLDLEIPDDLWPGVVERCRLGAMREETRRQGGMQRGFVDGVDAFFYKGTAGRWKELLTQAQIDRYMQYAADNLPADAARWLEHGSLALGTRPDAEPAIDSVNEPDPAARPHPVFDRLARAKPSNSIDAIAERAVEQARNDGLFDNLALHGKPIPDIDRQRRPGWWANQFVARERSKVAAMQLDADIRAAMPGLWRLAAEPDVRQRVEELNELIAKYNAATEVAPRELLDSDDTVSTWKRMQDR